MKKIGIIGAGNMGGSICRAIALSGKFAPRDLYVYDKNLKTAFEELGIKQESLENTVENADCIILAVKPNAILSVIEDIKKIGDISKKLIISIAAGVKLATLTKALSSQKVVRVMPNICLSANQGMCVMCKADSVTDDELSFARGIFDLAGKTELVNEELIDACTAINGSGPAYVFMFMEALADAGVRLGIDRQTAYRLTAQTVLGSAALLMESGKHPADLKDAVCSPGGTTIEAVKALEEAGLRNAVFEAVDACAKKAKEMGKS